MALSQLNALSTPLDEQQLVDLQTVIAKLSSEQVAWVSGYLTGLGAVGAPVSAPGKEVARGLTILYGSQTGNARSVADGIGRSALGLGYDVRVRSMADLRAERISSLRCCDLAYEEDAESWSKDVLNKVGQLDPERACPVASARRNSGWSWMRSATPWPTAPCV